MSTQKRTRRSVTGAGVNNQTENPGTELQHFEQWAEHVRQDFLAVLKIEMPDDVRGGIYIARQSLTRLIESGRALAKVQAESTKGGVR